ncbi:MAG: ROK family glucokinase [Lachnospiraceae bacterium]|nr:ROK family glucokinase [Lachnospiraceae bacterium]
MGKYAFGVDLGGTTVKMGLFDGEGKAIDKWEIPTRKEDNGVHILPDIAASINDKLSAGKIDPSEVSGVGIGVPGPVLSNGTVPFCVNLGWWDPVDLVGKIKELTGLDAKAGNDANVAALGEAWKGAGEGSKNVVMVTLGTGVGGGIIIDGHILHGSTGAGGEIGHITVNREETEKCNCGSRGCLEQYASATGIARLARRRLAKDGTESSLRSKNADDITAKDVFDKAKEGDKVALEVVDEFACILGTALSGVANTVNPELIVIGGGVSKAGEILTDAVKKYFDEEAFPAVKGTPIKLATLGNDAGIFGCVQMVL